MFLLQYILCVTETECTARSHIQVINKNFFLIVAKAGVDIEYGQYVLFRTVNKICLYRGTTKKKRK